MSLHRDISSGTGTTGRFYFRQLLAGTDFTRDNRIARQMCNFVYLIGDRARGEAVVVDPAWAPGELTEILESDGMHLAGVLATHHHSDHVGGLLLNRRIPGVEELLAIEDVPVHVHRDELPLLSRSLGVGKGSLVGHASGETVMVGEIAIECIHTPGHTPGGQCFLVDGLLVSGDTLFVQGCGRTDLPGGDSEAMYESLVHRLARLPDDTVLFPGHRYAPEPSATLGWTRQNNAVFLPKTLEDWLSMFGA